MKIRIIVALFGIVLSGLLMGLTQPQASCALVLVNAKTNKSIKVCDKNSVQKIEAVLGGAITLDKEVPDAKEPPIFTFTYDGLVIELQNDLIRSLAITGKKWKLNTLTVGIPLDQVSAAFEKHEFNYLGNARFKVKDSKAILYTETDQANKVKKIGVVF